MHGYNGISMSERLCGCAYVGACLKAGRHVYICTHLITAESADFTEKSQIKNESFKLRIQCSAQ